MAANHNSQGPEGNYDPAGSTQMFRAFVEEAAPAGPAGPGPAVPGARRRASAAGSGSSSKTGLWLGLGVALLLVVGAVAWLAL
ncbi:hypothetical protein ACFVYT_08265 [Streptomyces sp. NPDC058290]|uniref:hypothetical protein n=1 Tax=Streptomyces sp. NPDC058290 TaxID=3346426 RepID=UPI0036E4C702